MCKVKQLICNCKKYELISNNLNVFFVNMTTSF